MADDLIAPFLKELRAVAHLLRWTVDPKTGRIFARHPEYEETFSVIEAVAWGMTGLRYKGVETDSEFAAARAIGVEAIAYQIMEVCDRFPKENERKCVKEVRRSVLFEIGLDWRQ